MIRGIVGLCDFHVESHGWGTAQGIDRFPQHGVADCFLVGRHAGKLAQQTSSFLDCDGNDHFPSVHGKRANCALFFGRFAFSTRAFFRRRKYFPLGGCGAGFFSMILQDRFPKVASMLLVVSTRSAGIGLCCDRACVSLGKYVWIGC